MWKKLDDEERLQVLYQYQYNANLAPTRTQLQSIAMVSSEGFKDYAHKWRDLAGRFQPPLFDRERVDMFLDLSMGLPCTLLMLLISFHIQFHISDSKYHKVYALYHT